jgi:hypothetical protein
MWTLLNSLGLDGNWLPALVSLVLIPSLYIVLAIDVHKEYGDLIRTSVDKGEVGTAFDKNRLYEETAEKLRVFDLEWWLVGSFGVLIVAIMSSGYLTEWSHFAAASQASAVATTFKCQTASTAQLLCVVEPSASSSPVRTAMSLYATMIGLLVGFRLGWARLKLAQDLKHYYITHHRTRRPRGRRERA